jgi:hypothetical protein
MVVVVEAVQYGMEDQDDELEVCGIHPLTTFLFFGILTADGQTMVQKLHSTFVC